MTDENSVPKSRREVWLSIALAVANGLPEPQCLRIHPDEPIVSIYLTTHDEGAAWAQWAGATADEPTRSQWWSSHRDFGGKWGYSWSVMAPIGLPLPTEVEQELAAQVVEAIGAGS